jgi:DNA polymerase I
VGRGKVVDIAVATDGYTGYFPFDHKGGGNLEKAKVIQWFKDVCKSDADKIFHNAMYDVCWIRSMGIKINGRIFDTMIAASLVNENRFRFDLNSLGWDYVGRGKNETELRAAANEWGIDPKSDMWMLPAMYVGSYAERDAELTLDLWKVMQKEIIDQDLESIFNLETDLFPCLVDMKFKGVRVDVENAHKLKQKLSEQEKLLLQEV